MEEAIVCVERGELKLPVINLTDDAVALEEGKELGLVTEVRSYNEIELQIDTDQNEGVITKMKVGELITLTDDERCEKLRALLIKSE